MSGFLKLRCLVAVFSSILLASCGGGGGGGGSSSQPTTYSVGGHVSGLTADGLVLSNGAETIQLNANSTAFSFPGRLGSGSSYAVTVAKQPSGFVVNCSIESGGSGTILADVQVSVLCRAALVSVSTVAGVMGRSSVDGTGADAGFSHPEGVAVDSVGNVYVADSSHIRKITPAGVVTTLAGGDAAGNDDGVGAAATFFTLSSIAVDTAGDLYVADSWSSRIRKVTSSGVVTTLAGGSQGSANGTGSAAQFYNPLGIAVDNNGYVYIADTNNHQIRKITPAGVVSTLAGSTSSGHADGNGVAASFSRPNSVAVDGLGNVYVGDTSNNMIRMITPAGVVTTLAGGAQGNADGVGSAAQFSGPRNISVDGAGNIYVADFGNNSIRKVTQGGVVTTLAGNPNFGHADGTGAGASFNAPSGVAVDGFGSVYVADTSNYEIRKVTAAGTVSTIAGRFDQSEIDDIGALASFNRPMGVAVDNAGNSYVADRGNNKIRKISAAGVVSTLAGNRFLISIDGIGTSAGFHIPEGIASDNAGNMYVADTYGHQIRKITPDGVVSTLAGSGSTGSQDGNAAQARFFLPGSVAVDSVGNVYVADSDNHEIRKITPAGIVSTLAGSTTSGHADGTGAAASFNYPCGIALDAAGNIYVADTGNQEIRKITGAGVVTTLAGSPVIGNDDGAGAAARFSSPRGIVVDRSGNMYVADAGNNKIRKITAVGIVSTLAGNSAGHANGVGSAASFFGPSGLAIDSDGNIVVADTENNLIRKLSAF